MRSKPDRKNSKGKTILEETDGYTNLINFNELCTDTIALEEDFTDMQMLIYDILQDLPATPLDNTTIECIFTLEQICMIILEKINTKLQ